jgi:glycosyltransferase involved in cell wall biosynthesis
MSHAVRRRRAQGMMKGEALSEAYASGDVFVMPSESETLGFVVLEAMASRIPVVAVAAGGLTDIITRPGENGARAPRQRRAAGKTCQRDGTGSAWKRRYAHA